MKKLFLTIFCSLCFVTFTKAQIQLQTTDLTGTYKYSTSVINPYGIHDPSVVWDTNTQMFYVYGSHYAGAKSKDLRNWTGISKYYKGSYDSANAYKAFQSCPTHTVKRCLPGSTTQEEVTLGSYDAGAFASIYASNGTAAWVSGCQWAPDIVYNPNSGKWNYYLSINGDNWASVIVLMTGDSPEGPFTYEGPVVFGGFNNQSYDINGTSKKVDYKNTDLEVVLGSLSSLPGRYNKGTSWGGFWPNCIDPCVFFDEDGEMWMSYGSWSGGIWLLKLDKNTGLRDYTYTYSGTSSSISAQQTSDAYFGKLIAGGAYVSGEGSYIQHIGDYYYLFISYGFYSPDGGYEMRVFRSSSPDGPYVDAKGTNAINTSYQMNYGPKAATNKGMRLYCSYDKWGTQTLGECAQGHNSACQDDLGRSFLVCHTKFTDHQTTGIAAHAMRAHQLFVNKLGWLCVAPFQFNGETITDADIASTQPWSATDIEGDYEILIHPYQMDYANYAVATPKNIHLAADGKVTGDYSGTWSVDEGTSYFQIKIANVIYNGVLTEQTIQGSTASYRNTTATAKALCFSGVCSTSSSSSCGVTIWGYKMQPPYAIAYNYQTYKSPYFSASSYRNISSNVELMFETEKNVTLTWTSSNPDVVSNTGKYDPPAEDTSLTLTARMESCNYYWESTFSSNAKAATEISGDATTGLIAYYNFDDKPTYNLYNESESASYNRATTASTVPTLGSDWSRFGQVVHQYAYDKGKNSYIRMPNPLVNQDIEGFTVSLWVKRNDNTDNLGTLWSFFNGITPSASGARLYMTGNPYLRFDDNAGDWFTVNDPEVATTTLISQGEWHLVTFTFSKDAGYTIYVDGSRKIYVSGSSNNKFSGSAEKANFDYSLVVDMVKSAKYFYLGMGSSDGGSADAYFDDLMIYNRELTREDVKALNTLINRVNDFSPEGVVSVPEIAADTHVSKVKEGIYDLFGRKVATPTHGIYIVNGKKVLYK